MKDNKKMKELYKLYGFDLAEERDECLIFTFSNGYFYNCEILMFDDVVNNIEILKKQYENLGYSVRSSRFKNYESLESKLYTGFFNITLSKKKRLLEYQKYIENQNEKIYGGNQKYTYVTGAYLLGTERYEDNIIDTLSTLFQNKGAQLILVEAAAGFGKTCTSYEIMNRLAQNDSDKVPIFIELSKNRNAKIFRHVLLDAIDNNYSYLSSEVVKYAIEKGNIPLIVDGFDELLSKSINDNDNDNKKNAMEEKSDAQNMLATIAELLGSDSNAKIMLTSRKSSLFTGEEFDEWVVNNLSTCDVTRITIEEPTLQNWLGADKVSYINSKKIPFNTISNPIILSLYRNMKYEEFVEKCEKVEEVLKDYFITITKREMKRQSLVMNEDEQYNLFVSLAKEMVELDISAEEPKFIQEIIEMILGGKIKEYIERYDINQFNEERPNDEEFVQKLVRHAVLDRKSQDSYVIGFINDFIFGIFIGEALVKGDLDSNTIGVKYIELAATSYAVRSEEQRKILYLKIENTIRGMELNTRIAMDMNLISRSNGVYENGYISSMSFSDAFIFEADSVFKNVCFNECVFKDIHFYDEIFIDCQFINCKFFNCTIVRGGVCEGDVQFIACEGLTEWKREKKQEHLEEKNYQKIVLEQYWRPGRGNADPKHTYRTLLKGMTTSEYANVDKAISELKENDILSVKGPYLVLNLKQINRIKEILGR